MRRHIELALAVMLGAGVITSAQASPRDGRHGLSGQHGPVIGDAGGRARGYAAAPVRSDAARPVRDDAATARGSAEGCGSRYNADAADATGEGRRRRTKPCPHGRAWLRCCPSLWLRKRASLRLPSSSSLRLPSSASLRLRKRASRRLPSSAGLRLRSRPSLRRSSGGRLGLPCTGLWLRHATWLWSRARQRARWSDWLCAPRHRLRAGSNLWLHHRSAVQPLSARSYLWLRAGAQSLVNGDERHFVIGLSETGSTASQLRRGKASQRQLASFTRPLVPALAVGEAPRFDGRNPRASAGWWHDDCASRLRPLPARRAARAPCLRLARLAPSRTDKPCGRQHTCVFRQ